MESVGFQGLAEDVGMTASPHSVSDNLRAAWKMKLEREGKLSQGSSVRDLVFGSSDQQEE